MGTLKKIFQRLSGPKVQYQPLIEVRIFKDAILHNLSEYQNKYQKIKFAPVLKSNAYGHGLVEVASILDKKDLPFFMVDSFFESLVLRRAGIKTKILILGYNREEQILKNSLPNVSFGIMDLGILRSLSNKIKNKINIHLKVDTGMHRQGILSTEIAEAMRLIKNNYNINLEGLCSHLADADGEDKSFTQAQIKSWNKVVIEFKKEFSDTKYFHLSNTAGAYFNGSADVNVGRLGLGLYGINTSTFEKLNLRPALEMVSMISSLKQIPAGDKVGYNVTYEAKESIKVATVPVGYNEGVDRRLSNKGGFKVKGIFCPLVGRVSMNMSSINVSQVSDVKLEQEVIVISSNPKDVNSVENISKISGIIAHEILVHIPQQLRRRII